MSKMVLLVALVLGMGLSATAADRYVSLSGTHQPPFTNWFGAATNIQSAVNASVNGDRIWVTNGLYRLKSQISVTNGVTVIGFNGTGGAIVDGGYPANTNRCFYLNHSNAVLDGLTITNGFLNSTLSGGGVYVGTAGGTIRNCEITGNRVAVGQAFGGGIFLSGSGLVSNCTVRGNHSLDTTYGGGGGIFSQGGSIVDCVILENTGGAGAGGIYAGGGTIVVSSILSNNLGGPWGGGGISMGSGAIVRNCLISHNNSRNGGGVSCDYGAIVDSSTIVLNNASGYGGAYYARGGGILGSGFIRNTIITSNTCASGIGVNYDDTCTNISYSCSFPLPPGIGNISADPLFISPALYDFQLSTNSPCVDAGTNLSWMAGATDFGGTNRIIGGRVDMGAYETTLDSDTDGIPDWWMIQYFGHPTGLAGDLSRATDDFNYDGRSNLQEYLDGTNPTQILPHGDRFVSPAGHHQPPFTNWWAAATNIQDAVASAYSGETVWVTNGVYKLTNQISISSYAINVSSVNGPQETTIDGGYPSTKIRCINVNNQSTISGFTIQNGCVTNTSDYGGNGGGIRLGANGIVQNCIIQNNYAISAGGGVSCGNRSIIQNSILYSNTSSTSGGGIYCGYAGTVRNCLIYGNAATNSGGGILCDHLGYDGGNVENCTIVSNTANYGGGIYVYQQGFYAQGYVRNLVVYYNTATTSGDNYYNLGGSPTNRYSYCCTTPIIGNGGISNAPVFAFDYRLSSSSPCIDKGTNLSWMAGAADLGGTNRIIGGRVDMGAYETTLDSDTDGIPDWWMIQYFGHPTGLAGDLSRATDDYDGDRYTTKDEYLNGTAPKLFTYGRALPFNADRYVSKTGTHQYPYTNWFTAATNIQNAVTAAGSGDTVWVTNGVYTGTNNISIDYYGYDISLKSVNGPNVTIIDVAHASENCGLYFHSGESSNAVVDGFTIKNGSITYRLWGGGGICCDGGSPTIRNCIFDSNFTHRSGGGIFGTPTLIENCVFMNNVSQWGGDAFNINGGTVDSCIIISNNYGWGACFSGNATMRNSVIGNNHHGINIGVGASVLVESCTIYGNATFAGLNVDTLATAQFINTVWWANVGTPSIATNANVIFRYSCIQQAMPGNNNIVTDPLVVNPALNIFSLKSSSPCLDKGTNISWMVGAKDLDGNTRIQNGRVDMGAYELGFYIGIRLSAVDVTWNSASGVTYQVQSCTNLIAPSWTNVGSSLTATGTSSYVPDWIRDNNQKYYRVIIP